MTDLTAITTPFGLLDRETQEALKAHGPDYQVFSALGTGWAECNPDWSIHMTYRVKPAPPKPREWWLLVGANGFVRSAFPEKIDACGCHDKIVHVREVLE